MTTLDIRFYEGAAQYRVMEVLEPQTNANLFAGVLEELNHQYNYRPTVEDLWVEVLKDGEVLCRVERIGSDTVSVNYIADKVGKFTYSDLQPYSLTGVLVF